MGRRSSITRGRVASACNEIVMRGDNPTVRAVRASLGSGSMDTIAKFLRHWKAAQRRPASLSEVVACGIRAGHTDPFLREFLDEFYIDEDSISRQERLMEEPEITGIDTSDAYVAAVAEHLALEYGLTIPEWTKNPDRFLRRAYFPAGLESLKATLIKESPSAFRRRLIFVDRDPLFRPRKLQSWRKKPHKPH